MVILLATDRSPEAEGARQMLQGWDFEPADSVAAITVLEGGVPEDERTPNAHDFISVHADRGAGSAPDSIRGASLQWRTLEREGDPAEQILTAAQELGSNLIVVGATGMGRMRRLLVGSVALAVSRHASCSVLAVRRPFQPIRSVLVATDGSSPAHAAVQALLTLPLAPRPRAHVVFVLHGLKSRPADTQNFMPGCRHYGPTLGAGNTRRPNLCAPNSPIVSPKPRFSRRGR